ncbi:MAG TPA: alpha-glucan family phosphorylase, partial [Candidatus Binatia bacterium]
MTELIACAEPRTIAYFSMDVAIDSTVPTYSGGLGILAGDMLHSAADLGLPMVGVTLLHRKGYFDQRLDAQGNQLESPSKWSPESYLDLLLPRVAIAIEGRTVYVRAWQYLFRGITGHAVPILFLDTALDENDPRDRVLTDHLYGGDERYRLCQEVVLGFGGVAMLRALGNSQIRIFHMNEGHSALITLALLEERRAAQADNGYTEAEVEAVRRQCVFTTHTPVPAGHDRFPTNLINEVLGEARLAALDQLKVMNGDLNMTELALRFSGFVNGVSMRHGQVS